MLGAGVLLAIAAAAPAAAPAGGCWRVVHEVAAGAFPVASDFAAATSCDGAARGLRYDPASGLARAARRLQPGDVVPGAPASTISGRRAGEALTLQVQVGPVVVERQVVVLRPLRDGGVLVRAADGEVFATSAAEPRP